jgi:acetyl esterase/lipase
MSTHDDNMQHGAPAAPHRRTWLIGSLAAMLGHHGLPAALAQGAVPQGRELPARPLPVPDTISDALQQVVGAPLAPGWDTIPADAAGWKALAAASAQAAAPFIAAIKERLRVTVTRNTIGGVPVFLCTPEDIAEANRDRVLMHLHGGGYVLFPGEAGAGEGMMMAAYGRIRVVSVDYRMAPDFPFPAALDDAVAVWRALLAQHDPRRTGILGTSAGGGLTLALLLRARERGVPLPAAVAPGSPWVDLTGRGDSIQANAFVDNALVAMTGWAGAAAKLYAGAADLRTPLVSPIYGDFAGLPPALITSGTRDLFLSDAVRTHRRLRQAGVDAQLQVFEAQSHAQFLTPFVPETEEAFGELAGFFDRHLAR